MASSQINFSEENPFSRIKIRQFILWLFIFAVGSSIQMVIILAIINNDFSFKHSVAGVLSNIIGYPLGYLLTTYWYSQTNNVLERFREGIGLWLLLLVIPAPWVIGFIYKKFPNKNSLLPYFANQEQVEYRELNNSRKIGSS